MWGVCVERVKDGPGQPVVKDRRSLTGADADASSTAVHHLPLAGHANHTAPHGRQARSRRFLPVHTYTQTRTHSHAHTRAEWRCYCLTCMEMRMERRGREREKMKEREGFETHE